jgi:hypothetical protein
MKLIDKNKRGFARYCPTFARAWRGMEEGIGRFYVKRDIKQWVKKHEGTYWKVYEEKGTDRSIAISVLVKALKDKDKNIRSYAVESFRDGPWKGEDFKVAIPSLVKMLRNKYSYIRNNAAIVLGYAAEKGAEITIAIPALVKALGDEDVRVSRSAVMGLGFAAWKGSDIRIAIPALTKVFEDDDKNIHSRAAWALGGAAKNGTDITIAIPALAKLLEDEDIQKNAAGALAYAAENKADIAVAIPALVKLLGDLDGGGQEFSAWALENAAELSHETRVAISKEVMDLTNSNWLKLESEKNSNCFVSAIKKVDELLKKIDRLEQAA